MLSSGIWLAEGLSKITNYPAAWMRMGGKEDLWFIVAIIIQRHLSGGA